MLFGVGLYLFKLILWNGRFMKAFIFSFALVCSPLFVFAGQLKCEYGFSGSPLGTVTLAVDDKGVPAETATVAMFYTPAREMPVSNENPQNGEMLRLILSKDDPNNEIHMMVYPPQGNTYKSKLINPAAPPVMKELSGSCQLL